MNLRFDNPNAVEFTVDAETRTIRGLAVPYGDVAMSGGRKWSFGKGTLTWSRAKVLVNHNWNEAVGTAEFEDTDAGLLAVMKIARGAEGDRVLSLAEDGVFDGLSIGLGNDVKAALRAGVQHVRSGVVNEVSVTPAPAFDRARVTSVAASATDNEGNLMDNETTETIEAAPSFSAADGKALSDKVDGLVTKVDALADMKAPVEQAATLSVAEEPMYRFSGTTPAPSGFDFATDLLAAAIEGDRAAFKRVQEFTEEYLTAGPSFVDTGDTANVNPAVYRPDLFLGQAPVAASPLYDTFHVGGLSSVTPFFWSKLDRAATDVGVHDHVEGVDPADDDLVTAVGATVTPAPVSGKVHITREVADQGGNPQVSGLVWAEFERSFKMALEAKTFALVSAVAGTITSLNAAIAAGADGKAAGQAIEAGLLGLQFLADGSRFTKSFGHVDLYTALATYENADGEKRYPIINPQNRSGVSGSKYSFIDIAGYRMEPAASLGATSAGASNSYVVDPTAVKVWNSGLNRLDKLNESVEGWDLGVFAYFAGVVHDISGLRKIAYDPQA